MPNEAQNTAGYLNWIGYSEDPAKATTKVPDANQYHNSAGRSQNLDDAEKR